jgi:hypothetical protein
MSSRYINWEEEFKRRPPCHVCWRTQTMMCRGYSLCDRCVSFHLREAHGPLPPHKQGPGLCTGCASQSEAVGDCVCGHGICEHCVEGHFGSHGW